MEVSGGGVQGSDGGERSVDGSSIVEWEPFGDIFTFTTPISSYLTSDLASRRINDLITATHQAPETAPWNDHSLSPSSQDLGIGPAAQCGSPMMTFQGVGIIGSQPAVPSGPTKTLRSVLFSCEISGLS